MSSQISSVILGEHICSNQKLQASQTVLQAAIFLFQIYVPHTAVPSTRHVQTSTSPTSAEQVLEHHRLWEKKRTSPLTTICVGVNTIAAAYADSTTFCNTFAPSTASVCYE